MGEMTTNQMGAIAEAAFTAAAIRLGYFVLRPTPEGRRYDLVLDLGHRLLRVQCKWARREKNVIVVRARTSRFTPTAGYLRTTYTAAEIDALGIYCPDLEECFLVPIEDFEGQGFLHLRVGPTHNGQRGGCRLASQYRLGAVAQLGERVSSTHEATGSSPVSSTPQDSGLVDVGAHEFRNHFGYYMDVAAAGNHILVRRHGRPFVRLLAATAPPPAQEPRPPS